jgi:GMP synthase (glutamine-hydrolysing)
MSIPKVALLDAGAQLEKVIMRRVIEQGYSITKFPVNVAASELQGYDAIIISGGPRSVYASDALLPDPEIYSMKVPILGICYGMQAIAHQLGGKVARGEKGQYGRHDINITKSKDIFYGMTLSQRVLMSHFDTVAKEPDYFAVYATCDGQNAAIGNSKKKIYAMQFHPELIPVTKNGAMMFENFFLNVCHFPKIAGRNIDDEIEQAKRIIRETVGKDKYVMHYMSGGVDSTVMALLLAQSIEPERLHIRLLDTGTMRSGEVEAVIQMAKELNLPNFEALNVQDRFYSATREIQTKSGKILAGPLCYATDPETKRKLFGTEYAVIALTEIAHIANKYNVPIENILLGQGTLRPDVIESGDSRVTMGEAHTIKTHHNAVDALKSIPKVEPLIELFKDQVREIALKLGMPESFAYRQPFPGPGLYCRIIGYDMHNGRFKNDEEFRKLEDEVNNAGKRLGFNAHVLPIKTVGVQGDERSYKNPVIVSGEIDWAEFKKFSLSLPNEIRQINRVIYTPGDALSFEECVQMTPTFMNHESIAQSQSADFLMREIAELYGFNDSRKCSQMPGILIPSNFGNKGKRSFVVRPCYTHDFMAIIGMMPAINENDEPKEHFPLDMFMQMAKDIPEIDKSIARIILDPTDKPPGSTEWE